MTCLRVDHKFEWFPTLLRRSLHGPHEFNQAAIQITVLFAGQDEDRNLESGGKASHVRHLPDHRIVGDYGRDKIRHVRGKREGTATTHRETDYYDLTRKRIRRPLCLLNSTPQINLGIHARYEGKVSTIEKNSIVTESGYLGRIALVRPLRPEAPESKITIGPRPLGETYGVMVDVMVAPV